jgi:PAS domain-containing protein
LYTGDARYLAPYDQARVQIDSHFNELMRLTDSRPQEQSSLVELRALEQVKMSELQQTLDLYREGKTADARGLVLSDFGLLTMEHFRQIIDQVEKTEASLESVRVAEYQKTVRRTIASIYLASVLATIGLALLAYHILREMSLREKHAREIHEREEWFRVTLTSIGDAVIVTDESGRVAFMNPVAESLIGTRFANTKGRDISDVLPFQFDREPPCRLCEIVLANHTVLKHADVSYRSNSTRRSATTTENLSACLVFRDVANERRRGTCCEVKILTARLSALYSRDQ